MHSNIICFIFVLTKRLIITKLKIMNLEEQLKDAEMMVRYYGSLEENSTNKEDILKYRRLKNKYSDLADNIYNKLLIKY